MDYLGLDALKKELQAFFTDGLVTVIGSGLSAAEGIPGMRQLAEHLQTTIQTTTLDEASSNIWRNITQALEDRTDLETALQQYPPPDTLNTKIVTATATFISQHERRVFHDILTTSRTLLFTRLVRHYLHTDKPIPIITTNYDRLLELACEMAELTTDTLFVGSTSAAFRPDTSHWQSCRGVFLRGSPRRQPSIRWATRAVVLKPHGSLDWHMFGNDPVRLSVSVDTPPLMITPGLSKYRSGYDSPFDAHRERANRYIDRASRFLTLGYGFNDEHLQTHLAPEIRKGKPTLIIARTLTDAAQEIIRNGSSTIALSAPVDNTSEGTLITRQNSNDHLQDVSLWDLHEFIDEVLEP